MVRQRNRRIHSGSRVQIAKYQLNSGNHADQLVTFTAPFNKMRTLKFKAQQTNAFFATVNQMSGGPSQLPSTVERAVIESLSTVRQPDSARK